MSNETNQDFDEAGRVRGAEHRTLFERMGPVTFALLSLCAIFFLYQVVGGVLTLLLFGGNLASANVQHLRLATLIGQILFILLPTLLLARARSPNNETYFPVRIPETKEVVLVVISVLALQQLLQGYMLVQDMIPLPEGIAELIESVKNVFEQTYRILVTAHTPEEFLFVVLVVAVTPALCEEFLFRGLVQQSIAQSTTGFRAAMISGIIFGLYHMNPFSLLPLIALGMYFGFIVYRTKNILPAIVAHFFNNFVASLAAYMQLDDNFVAVSPTGEVTTEMLIVNYALSALVFLASTYYFFKATAPPIATRP